MREFALALLVFTMALGDAHAGAWTQKKHHWQVISSFDVSRAGKGYDGGGRADAPIKFDKLYSKSLIEYGVSDRLTLFAAPEYIVAQSTWANGQPAVARDLAAEAGARLRLSNAFGVLSLQASYKFSGPSDLSNGPIHRSWDVVLGASQTGEIRLLYGTGFKFFGRDGFFDLEAAQRFISSPRPNETVLDATLGLWFGTKMFAMLQSFNVVSGGDADAPYTYFRTHKTEISLVRRLSPSWSVQLGGFMSPAGQNALVEEGVTLAVWRNL